ncbi:hypothetical protein VNO80_02979 [Phaseolus coccineus]|uniref:Uncharacterized protein n=1 Tax=Phaseolus coccineus TaxID=3886 RepID=A0AAN9RRL8_PHACN
MLLFFNSGDDTITILAGGFGVRVTAATLLLLPFSSRATSEATTVTHPSSTFRKQSSNSRGHLGVGSYPLRIAKGQQKLRLKEATSENEPSLEKRRMMLLFCGWVHLEVL